MFLDGLMGRLNQGFANAGRPDLMHGGFLDGLMMQQQAMPMPLNPQPGMAPVEAQASSPRAPGGFLDNLHQSVSDNRGMLMGLGTDLMSDGWAGAGRAMAGMQMDEARRSREAEQGRLDSQMAAQRQLGERYGVNPLVFDAGMGEQELSRAMRSEERPAPTTAMRNLEAAGYDMNTPAGQQAMRDHVFGDNTNISPGYRQMPDGSWQAIPGSPAHQQQIEAQAAGQQEAQQAANSFRSIDQQSQTIIDNLDAALSMLERDPNVAGFGSLQSIIPGAQARDFQARLDTIRAIVGFEQLQQMRENSPTGGALGQVTERELAFLQSVQGSLDQAQSPEQLDMILRNIRETQATFRAERQRIFEQQYGISAPGTDTSQSRQSGNDPVGIR